VVKRNITMQVNVNELNFKTLMTMTEYHVY